MLQLQLLHTTNPIRTMAFSWFAGNPLADFLTGIKAQWCACECECEHLGAHYNTAEPAYNVAKPWLMVLYNLFTPDLLHRSNFALNKIFNWQTFCCLKLHPANWLAKLAEGQKDWKLQSDWTLWNSKGERYLWQEIALETPDILSPEKRERLGTRLFLAILRTKEGVAPQ